MSEYGTEAGTSDRSNSNEAMSKDQPPKLRSKSTKRALKTANKRLCQSSRQRNPVIRYMYNEYMTHHYVYITNVAEIRETESYA